ncbi:MAG: hypothetical protein H6Q64_734 [Firmicutes bacterium]|nr:hypothetical protein [Bacillota bacterium]
MVKLIINTKSDLQNHNGLKITFVKFLVFFGNVQENKDNSILMRFKNLEKGRDIMYKYFIRPFKKIIILYSIAALGIAADIAQLTSFHVTPGRS